MWLATRLPFVLLAVQVPRVLLAEDGAVRWCEAAAPEVLGALAEPGPPVLRLTSPRPAPPSPLPVGTSDFRTLRRDGARYVDKTGFISEVLCNRAQVLLFTHPRRFGKTMPDMHAAYARLHWPMPWLHAVADSGSNALMERFGVVGVPSLLFVDVSGVVIEKDCSRWASSKSVRSWAARLSLPRRAMDA